MAYAFSSALAQGLLEKYSVVCDAELVVEKVKALCPAWDGHWIDKMAQEWNDKHAESGASIEDTDKSFRYNVKIDFKMIESFTEANEEMKLVDKLRIYMPCTISTNINGHALHAVVLEKRVSSETMEARNSWGAKQAFVEVSSANFRSAITFDPIITAATRGKSDGDAACGIPPVRKVYSQRMEESNKDQAKQIQTIVKTMTTMTNIASIIEESKKYAGDNPRYAEIQKAMCTTLCALASKNQKNRLSIVKKGGIDAIIKALVNHRDHTGVQEQGCWALLNLAGNADNEVAIGERLQPPKRRLSRAEGKSGRSSRTRQTRTMNPGLYFSNFTGNKLAGASVCFVCC